MLTKKEVMKENDVILVGVGEAVSGMEMILNRAKAEENWLSR